MKRGKQRTSSQDRLLDELKAVNTFINSISEKYDCSFHDIISMLHDGRKEDPILIPTCIFKERKLGLLQCVIKYLKEQEKLSYVEIARILNKDQRVVWVTHNNAKKKVSTKFKISDSKYWLPVSIFCESEHGPLGTIVIYLCDSCGLDYKSVSKLIGREPQLISTVYNRWKKGAKK